MLRKSWVVVGPLLASLVVHLAVVAFLLLFGMIVFLVSGGPVSDISGAWLNMRPVAFAGTVVFVAIAVLRWVLHLVYLRSRLRDTETSLQEYANWSAPIRAAWLKEEVTWRRYGM